MSHADAIALPGLPKDDDGPVFAEPWQAKAFALALELHQQGLFEWREWAETLAEEIEAAQARGDPDLGNTYYEHWLRALERLVQGKGAADGEALAQRKEAWRRAYLHTPHGKPIDLQTGLEES